MYLISLGLYWGKWDLVPWLGIEPRPLCWEQGVLATRPPGKSWCIHFFWKSLYWICYNIASVLWVLFFLFFFWLGRETFGIFASQPMIEPAPSALEGKVLIPGSPDVFIYHISPDHNHIIIIITMSSPDHNHISPDIFLFKHREMEAQRWLESCSKSHD